MPRGLIAIACVPLLLAPWAFAQPDAPPPGGVVAGVVRDAAGEPAPGVCVIVCDAETGVPLDRETDAPFTADLDALDEALDRLLFTRTDDRGAFELTLPPGAYRLVAQAWDQAPEQVLGVNGVNVRLYGVSGALELDPGETERVGLAPPGVCTLAVHARAGNSDSLFLVSAAPTRADPILGFAGWQGPFVRAMIGGNRAPLGRTVFHGLPAGGVHVAVFSPDNIPGWGAASVTLEPDKPVEVDVPWVVSWSDGVHSPPPRLEPLVEKLAGMPENDRFGLMYDALERTGFTPPPDDAHRASHALAIMAALGPLLDDPIELDDGTKHRTGDLLAALGYAQMRSRLEGAGRTPNPYRAPAVRPYEGEP